MQDCLFCKIVRGEIPSAQVFSSEHVLAFLDIGPIHKGHTLVIPKTHYATLWELPAALGQEMQEALQKVGQAVVQATAADGLNVVMNNFRAAGQLVDHAHWHLVPRFTEDGLRWWPQQEYESSESMEAVAQAIRETLQP
ncbi:HIT family protein [Desulfohalobium retbaense]|uniref:Histidine triad (HIT) protein n=1 Tax=Desulfohalobium retbaense (strain ATCC 49708 / DSM 5692 / JCM 16813 / HR100) TaxID=485915 RepID=C8X524_DESRD|nr:HIT family protein [Desulfohalobium retbaense]ACV69521.1 histidine triad (HIT) protein [Desulfohalobium retbaense DSM 5692]